MLLRTFFSTIILLCAGCDRFFALEGTVSRCDDGEPIEGATVRVAVADGSDDEDDEAVTGPDGRYELFLNEPETVLVDASFEAPGFLSVVRTLDGAPGGPYDVCLEPIP